MATHTWPENTKQPWTTSEAVFSMSTLGKIIAGSFPPLSS